MQPAVNVSIRRTPGATRLTEVVGKIFAYAFSLRHGVAERGPVDAVS